MYTLRIIEEERENESTPFEQVIENFELGDAYTKIKNGSSSEFDKYVEKDMPSDEKGKIDSVIIGSNGHTFYIMNNSRNREFSYYIMGDSGNTFEKLWYDKYNR